MKRAFIAENDLNRLAEDAKFAAENGFDGLEFNYWQTFEQITGETVGKMRDILDAAGLGCCSLGLWGWNHISPDPAERTTAQQYLGRAIEFARTLGAEVLITGGGMIPGASPEEHAARFAETFRPFVRRVRDAGMKLAMYPAHGNSFFQGIGDYERVWELGMEVGVKLDPANIRHHGDEYLPILRDHGDKVYHVHVKEHLYLAGQLASQPAAGMGDIEWGKVMAFLYEHQYAGYLSIEPHGPLWGRPPLREKMLLLTQRHIGQFLV